MSELPELLLVSEEQVQIWNQLRDQIPEVRADVRCGQVQSELLVVLMTVVAELTHCVERGGEQKAAAVDQTRPSHVVLHVVVDVRRVQLPGGAQERDHRSVETIVRVERQTHTGLEAVQFVFVDRFLERLLVHRSVDVLVVVLVQRRSSDLAIQRIHIVASRLLLQHLCVLIVTDAAQKQRLPPVVVVEYPLSRSNAVLRCTASDQLQTTLVVLEAVLDQMDMLGVCEDRVVRFQAIPAVGRETFGESISDGSTKSSTANSTANLTASWTTSSLKIS